MSFNGRSWPGRPKPNQRLGFRAAGPFRGRREQRRCRHPTCAQATRTDRDPLASKPGMDEVKREVIRAEGFDPDDPAVLTATDLVRRELSMIRMLATHLIFSG